MILNEGKANSGESRVDLRSLWTAIKISAREYATKIHHWNFGLRHTAWFTSKLGVKGQAHAQTTITTPYPFYGGLDL